MDGLVKRVVQNSLTHSTVVITPHPGKDDSVTVEDAVLWLHPQAAGGIASQEGTPVHLQSGGRRVGVHQKQGRRSLAAEEVVQRVVDTLGPRVHQANTRGRSERGTETWVQLQRHL